MNRFGDIDCSFKRLPPVYGYRSEKLVTIEQALQSIESQIDELPFYIKIAKKHCHYPSEHGLSKDQSAAVYIYTMEWGDTTLYRVLNNALRSEDRQSLKIWFPYLKLFDTALDKLPTVKEVVWRGVPLDIGKNFTKNQVLTWWSVNSCSSSASVFKKFIEKHKNATLFLIEAINGKKISGYTEYENEDEIILRMGTQFRVKSDVLEQNSSHIIHLIEINDDEDDEPLALTMYQMHVAPKPSTKEASGQFISSNHININTKWKQNGIIIAGGSGRGGQLNQLSHPHCVYIDEDHQCIYIADQDNNRIVEWKFGAKTGEVVAGGNGEGNRMNQLKWPQHVIVDKTTDSIIISDMGNERVVRWPRRNGTNGQIIISDIERGGLTMDNNGNLYVSNHKQNEVRRWKIGETNGTIVAGGNGKGKHLNQLRGPSHIFVDKDYSVYVSDHYNHRVMKWIKGAKEGIVVAGGQGEGNSLTQLHYPEGVIVDHLGQIYVADCFNRRIMRWSPGSKEGSIILGKNEQGQQSNSLSYPRGLSFDRQGNLYVTVQGNPAVQKFDIDSN